MGTFGSHHLPLRTLLPKLVFSLKNPIDFPSLVLITKLLLVLLKLFKIFLQGKQGTEMGFVFSSHFYLVLISKTIIFYLAFFLTKGLFMVPIPFLVCFKFEKTLLHLGK
jgi:hypothetical protein